MRSVLDVVFPVRCLGCGGSPGPFCARCFTQVVPLGATGCSRCGRPLARRVDRCADCPPSSIAWSRSALLYAGPVRAGLMRVKFSGWRAAIAAMAPALADLAAGAPVRSIRPTLTWVPLGRRRRRTRGFDQAEVLARALAGRTGWSASRLLLRVRETGPQARRGGEARRSALRGAFVACARPPPFVVLVDDVLTTGATAAECAAVLRAAGARRVGLLTLARALGGPVPPEP